MQIVSWPFASAAVVFKYVASNTMKAILSFFTLIISLNVCFSQSLQDSFLVDFYSKTIQNHYQQIIEDNPEYKSLTGLKFLLISDSLPKNAPTKFDGFNIQYVTEDEVIDLLSNKERDFTSYDFITVKRISSDTIYINIGGPRINVNKVFKIRKGRITTREVSYLVGDSGTNGYIPTARFILDEKENTWTFKDYDEILKEKLADRKKRLESWKEN